jgi:hypothetical protein
MLVAWISIPKGIVHSLSAVVKGFAYGLKLKGEATIAALPSPKRLRAGRSKIFSGIPAYRQAGLPVLFGTRGVRQYRSTLQFFLDRFF